MYVRSPFETYTTQSGCPDCGATAVVDEIFDPCLTTEELADEVLFMFLRCDTTIADTDLGNDLDLAELQAAVTAGDVILKPTENFTKAEPEMIERERGYSPSKTIGKTYTFTFDDFRKIAGVNQTHRKQWNQITELADKELLQVGYVTKNDEVYLFRVQGKKVKVMVSDPQEPAQNAVERLAVTVTVRIDENKIPVPYYIAGAYAGLAPMTDMTTVVITP